MSTNNICSTAVKLSIHYENNKKEIRICEIIVKITYMDKSTSTPMSNGAQFSLDMVIQSDDII